MIGRPPRPGLDGNTELRVGVDGIDGSGDANSGFCARLWAMASHDLRQPLQVIDGAHDVLAPIHHGASAQAQQARVEDATRQLADKAYGRLRAASAAGDEHATAARRVTDGALSAGWTLPRPRVGPYRKGPASAGPLEWHWSRRKSTECVRPQLAGVNRARNRGLGSRNPPPIIGLRSLQACNGVRQFCTAIPASRCKLAQVRRRLPTGGKEIRTLGPPVRRMYANTEIAADCERRGRRSAGKWRKCRLAPLRDQCR